MKWSTDPTPVVLKRYAYTYDPAGNRTIEQIDDSAIVSTYDALNRMTSQQPGGVLRVAGTLDEPATVSVQSKPATVTQDNRFEASVPVTPGTNTFAITAIDASGNIRAQNYTVDVTGPSQSFTYDANGNMTSDALRTFEWDAANELVAVNKGTHRSEFTYDGTRQVRKIVEREGAQSLRRVGSFGAA